MAEFAYRPTWCKKTYRMIVVRKDLSIEEGQRHLYDQYRYFFYIINDRRTLAGKLVLQANGRCNQENLIAQLHGGVRARPYDKVLQMTAGLSRSRRTMVVTGLPPAARNCASGGVSGDKPGPRQSRPAAENNVTRT